jgi:hypothetical protein
MLLCPARPPFLPPFLLPCRSVLACDMGYDGRSRGNVSRGVDQTPSPAKKEYNNQGREEGGERRKTHKHCSVALYTLFFLFFGCFFC